VGLDVDFVFCQTNTAWPLVQNDKYDFPRYKCRPMDCLVDDCICIIVQHLDIVSVHRLLTALNNHVAIAKVIENRLSVPRRNDFISLGFTPVYLIDLITNEPLVEESLVPCCIEMTSFTDYSVHALNGCDLCEHPIIIKSIDDDEEGGILTKIVYTDNYMYTFNNLKSVTCDRQWCKMPQYVRKQSQPRGPYVINIINSIAGRGTNHFLYGASSDSLKYVAFWLNDICAVQNCVSLAEFRDACYS
jgi:hypothetical protein